MLKTSKIAISLPMEDLEKIERIRKKRGLQRSAVIDEAIRFWLGSLEEEQMVKQYEDGYRKKPESLEELKAMEEASAKAFEEDGWE
jgi:metal-responsive CopG/Arc/MetJ family transcriptional regulator